MPPVRWKLFIAVILQCLTRQIAQADSLHDSMPMSSDGWRPIIGTSQRDVEDEITLYRNPTQTDENSEPVKAQPVPVYTPAPTSATKPYQTISTSKAIISLPPSGNGNNINVGTQLQGIKVPPHSKPHLPFMLVPHPSSHGHGPHIPLTSPAHKGSRRHPIVNKSHPLNGKRHIKPVRGPVIAHSMKNEVYIPAPSAAIGTFTFYNQGLGQLKSQGISGNKHFQPQFTSQFGLTGISGLPGNNDVVIQQVPVRTFLIQNRNPNPNPNIFVHHNDEYTRNLVPPPFKVFEDEKERQKLFKQKEQSGVVSDQAASIHNPQLIIGKPKEGSRHRPVVPENIIVQLPPPFEQQSQFGVNYNQQKIKGPEPVEVQVTKEKLKVFHNSVPPNYNPGENQYVQHYNFQNINKPMEEQKIYTFESFPLIKNTKQEFKLQTYRKPVTESYPIFEEPKREMFIKKPISEAPNFPTYEVTEGKPWQEGFQPFISTRPSVITHQPLAPQPPPRMQPQPMEFVFLPTPYTPDSSVPTSPTQSEISSIYAELNQRNRPAPNEYSTLDPNFFSIKEVSTHYPIVGRPESPALFNIPATSPQNTEFSNEITTAKEEPREPFQIYQPSEEPEPTVPPTRPPPVREWSGQRQRPQRRRRPTQRTRTTTTTTTTTTEEPVAVTETYEVQKVQSSEENYSGETQRPHRRRRPSRVRTTEAPPVETTKAEEITRPTGTVRQRYRHRYDGTRIRPTASAESIEEMPSNHKIAEAVAYSGGILQPVQESIIGSEVVNHFRSRQTTEETPVSHANEVTKPERKPELTEATENYPKIMSFGKNYQPSESEEENSSNYQRTTERLVESQTEGSSSEEQPTQPRRRMRYTTTTAPTTTTSTTTTSTTTEHQSSSVLTPENEVDYDYSTQVNHFEPSKETITIQEVYNKIPEKNDATLATTTPPTTTSTTEASTTKTHRIRGRPLVKYDNKTRPLFSLKKYHQRLSQYSTSSTTTDIPRLTSESSRMRFINRGRKPISLASLVQEEEPSTERTKFTPKDPRHGSVSEATIPERKVNTRLRPFGRQRSTTEATTTTQKISIKPNIFNNLRRPPMISLRSRILNKHNRTNILEKTTEKPTNEVESGAESSEVAETTMIYNVQAESTTESEVKKVEENETTNDDSEHEEQLNTEIMKNESFLQSQRVSDLTSMSQKEYETPGLFKSVSPNTRIVPNYFTISTDDPILPIEAFFPNLKDKNPKSDYK